MDSTAYIIICGVSFVFATVIWGIIYYINYKGCKNKYKVTFIINEDETISNQIQRGEFVKFFSPQKTGKEFLGWFDNKECNGKNITYYMVYDKDVFFYAKWRDIA